MAHLPAFTLPPPEGPPGAPFDDPNLKLVVIDALVAAGQIDLGGLVHFLSQMLGRPYSPESDPQWLYKCQPAYDYLVCYPLSRDHLVAVESLCFDGGNAIYGYIWPGWDGEGGDFNVRALDGVELLSNLRKFDETAMLDANDFRPLTHLPKLESVGVGSGTKMAADVLLSLRSLKRFTCYRGDAPDPSVLDSLKARGVRVGMY
jgi:hypothetical protein